MKNKIDIGVFVKKAFESNQELPQPDRKVLERINETLERSKRDKKKIFFLLSFSVLLVSLTTYLFWESISVASSKDDTLNNTVNTYASEQLKDISIEEIIGPLPIHETGFTYENDFIENNIHNYYSLIIDTTYQDILNSKQLELKTKKENAVLDLQKHFKQKTVYHYYRSSDSLKIETTDKRVIDSIMSNKIHQKSIDDQL